MMFNEIEKVKKKLNFSRLLLETSFSRHFRYCQVENFIKITHDSETNKHYKTETTSLRSISFIVKENKQTNEINPFC